MKYLLTLALALVSTGILAQESQAYYAYADMNNAAEESTEAYGFEVNDLLLADPDFDIQENMISYTKDQKRVFFSAYKKLKLKRDNSEAKIKKSVRMHLFKADVAENGTWLNLEMLPFNSPRHSTGHPALNGDDSKLYFAADGPESTGKTDLFTVELFEDGTYGNPMNLGSTINSEEREIFPFVDMENVLYFASDAENEGKYLEVYASQVVNDEPSAPVKLDVAVNSPNEELIASYKDLQAELNILEEALAESTDLAILVEAEKEASEVAEEEAEKEAEAVVEKEVEREVAQAAEIESAEKQLAVSTSQNAYSFDSDRTIYTVQIGAFLKNVATGTFGEYSGSFNHQYQDGFNRFYSGVFDSEEEARAHLKQMKAKGFHDAFVLGLQGEKRLFDR